MTLCLDIGFRLGCVDACPCHYLPMTWCLWPMALILMQPFGWAGVCGGRAASLLQKALPTSDDALQQAPSRTEYGDMGAVFK